MVLRVYSAWHVKLDQARRIVEFVVAEASGPVAVFVADTHGEVVAAATMDGAAPDTRLNAQRKAYTAARSDATSTSALAAKVADDPVERASFDPFFLLQGRRRGVRRRSHGEVVAPPRWTRPRRTRAERAAQGLHGGAERRPRDVELAAKVADDPVERASFDPFFTFFKGGVAAFDGESRVGAVGVSGLPGEVDEDLARRAIEAAGLSTGYGGQIPTARSADP